MVLYMSAIDVIGLHSRQKRGKVNISFPVKLGRWCCASSVQKKKSLMLHENND